MRGSSSRCRALPKLQSHLPLQVLTISEVFVLFERNMDVWRRRDPDYQPSAMLQKAAEYAGRFATNKNRDTVQKTRE